MLSWWVKRNFSSWKLWNYQFLRRYLTKDEKEIWDRSPTRSPTNVPNSSSRLSIHLPTHHVQEHLPYYSAHVSCSRDATVSTYLPMRVFSHWSSLGREQLLWTRRSVLMGLHFSWYNILVLWSTYIRSRSSLSSQRNRNNLLIVSTWIEVGCIHSLIPSISSLHAAVVGCWW